MGRRGRAGKGRGKAGVTLSTEKRLAYIADEMREVVITVISVISDVVTVKLV